MKPTIRISLLVITLISATIGICTAFSNPKLSLELFVFESMLLVIYFLLWIEDNDKLRVYSLLTMAIVAVFAVVLLVIGVISQHYLPEFKTMAGWLAIFQLALGSVYITSFKKS